MDIVQSLVTICSGIVRLKVGMGKFAADIEDIKHDLRILIQISTYIPLKKKGEQLKGVFRLET